MTDRRPLLLGQCPSARGDEFYMFPLSGNPAVRICSIMGWRGAGAAYWRLTEHFDTLNAIERHADAEPWRAQVARDRWAAWLAERGDDPLVVVCLGRRAGNAVGLGPFDFVGEWVRIGYLHVCLAPHTSGRNREWNEPGTEDVVRQILTEALDRADTVVA